MIALEKEGLLDRSNPRMPHLTDLGEKRAKYYAERMEITLNHLLYEGVDIENAKSDAFQWALLAQMSPQTLLYLLRQDTSSAPAA